MIILVLSCTLEFEMQSKSCLRAGTELEPTSRVILCWYYFTSSIYGRPIGYERNLLISHWQLKKNFDLNSKIYPLGSLQ